ncbi:MAG: calcium/sodium antiporter [Pseudomonadota bacterium]
MDFLLAILGLLILLLAADALVKGAVNLSLRLGVPALIVSLTIVAFGTSAPELLIAVTSVLDDAPGLALGNVVGSNIANVLLVLGVPAILAPLATGSCETRKNYVYMLAASALFVSICFIGPITWLHGLILLVALAFVLTEAFRDAHAHHKETGATQEDEVEGSEPDIRGWRIALYLLLGLIGLPLGSDLLVDSAISIARRSGISETVIGLTLIAFGTSVPELATTVMAALRQRAEVALGNVIGSNIFNLLAIIGLASFVAPLPVSRELLNFDLWIMLASSLVLIPFVFMNRDISRLTGIGLTTAYGLYVLILFR